MNHFLTLTLIVAAISSTTACDGNVEELVLPEEVVSSIEVCAQLNEKYGGVVEFTYEELEDMGSLSEQCMNDKIKYIESGGNYQTKPVAK